MAVTDSVSPDISETLPTTLGSASAAAMAAYPGGDGWDISIGGIGFRLRPSKQHPYTRGTETSRKQQFDASDEAGEQSISNWWLRSGSSWHMGAGVKWYEPGAEEEARNRFGDSYCVDVWTQGELKLLPLMSSEPSSIGTSFFRSAWDGDQEGIFYVGADGVSYWMSYDHERFVYLTLPDDCTEPAVTGGIVWLGHPGGVSKVVLTGTGTVTEPFTCTGTARVWWVKSRLVVAIGSKLYEVGTGTTGAIESVGREILAPVSPGWEWTSIAETSSAILASGFAEGESAVFRFVLEKDDTGTPIISAGEQVAQMPSGELIRCMGVHLGTIVVLGTTGGVRIGAASDTGDVQYGPFTIEAKDAAEALVFADRFAYVAMTDALPDGCTGAARIDLSAQVGDSGRFAWAWDASTHLVGRAYSIAMLSGLLYIGLEGAGAMQTDPASTAPAHLEPEGWITTGAVRYRTAERKVFRRFNINAQLKGGKVEVTAVAPDESEHRVFTYDTVTGPDISARIDIPSRPTNTHMDFRIKLRVADDGDTSPILTGWQVKSLPAPDEMELVQFPVSLFDREVDRHGNVYSKDNGAFLRYDALREMKATCTTQAVVDTRTGEKFTALIESLEFTSDAPPDKDATGFGGVCLVTVRRI